MDRNGLFHPLPDGEHRAEGGGERAGGEEQTDVEIVSEIVGDESPHDAQQNHRGPVKSWNISLRANLQRQREKQKHGHDGCGPD